MTLDKALEYIAVVAGIASVWYSRKENILVYPVGLINTIIYIYLSLKGHLFGEASVNPYYTVVSIYGWYLWTRKNTKHEVILHITRSTQNEWLKHIVFFLACYAILFLSITFLSKWFPGAIPWADALASASAYTGMWLMAKKKVESWYWWIVTNIASIPLYYVKGYEVTSAYYLVLFVLAIFGLIEWRKRAER